MIKTISLLEGVNDDQVEEEPCRAFTPCLSCFHLHPLGLFTSALAR